MITCSQISRDRECEAPLSEQRKTCTASRAESSPPSPGRRLSLSAAQGGGAQAEHRLAALGAERGVLGAQVAGLSGSEHLPGRTELLRAGAAETSTGVPHRDRKVTNLLSCRQGLGSCEQRDGGWPVLRVEMPCPSQEFTWDPRETRLWQEGYRHPGTGLPQSLPARE